MLSLFLWRTIATLSAETLWVSSKGLSSKLNIVNAQVCELHAMASTIRTTELDSLIHCLKRIVKSWGLFILCSPFLEGYYRTGTFSSIWSTLATPSTDWKLCNRAKKKKTWQANEHKTKIHRLRFLLFIYFIKKSNQLVWPRYEKHSEWESESVQ